MDVENSFLDDSEDTGDESTPKTKSNDAFKRNNKNRGKSSCIRISPITRSVSEANLAELIKSKCGEEAIDIRLVYKKSKRISKKPDAGLYKAQAAFVMLSSAQAAANVADTLDQTKLGDSRYTIGVNVVGESRQNNLDLKGKTNSIVLSGFKNDVNEQQILTFIQKNSGIKAPPKTMLLRQHPRKSDFFGFVEIELASSKDAAKCVKNLRMATLAGTKVWAKYRTSRKTLDRKQELKGKTQLVLVGNLHWSLTEEDVKEMCSDFGEVLKVHVWFDASGYPRGMVLVQMGDKKAAIKVFEGLQGKKVKNLALVTAFTNTDTSEKVPQKKKIMKNKNIKKKVNITRENKKSKMRIDGVGSGGKKKRGSNASTGFAKKKKANRRGPKSA